MDKRIHHMTDPWPNRLDREEACAVERHPPPMSTGKSRKATPPSAKQLSDAKKAAKR